MVISWLCTRNDDFQGSDICILTGPSHDLSLKLVKRLKELWLPYEIYFPDAKEVLHLNGAKIQCYPSHNLSSYRSLVKPKFILLDEADFFGNETQQSEARDVSERYVAKSDPYIVMISTPNLPNQLFYKIEQEDEASCIYRRLQLSWQVGVGKIYTEADIKKAQASPSFPREYGLSYGFGTGTAFLADKIDSCVTSIDQITPSNVIVNFGIDTAFSADGSKFAIVATALIDDKIHIIEAQQHSALNFNDSINMVFNLMVKYGYNKGRNNTRIWVDAASPSWVRALKVAIGENEDYESVLKYASKHNIPESHLMVVVPIGFGEYGRPMLQKLQAFVSDSDLVIPHKFQDLIMQMRIAKVKENGNLDKSSNPLDLVDAARLSCFNIE